MIKNKTVSRAVSFMLSVSMLLGMVWLPVNVFATTQYGNIELVDEDFSDVSDLTIPNTGKVITPGQYLKLDGTAGTVVADYDDPTNEFVITRSWVSVKEHTFDLRLAEGASVTFEINSVFKSTENDGSITDHNEYMSCKLSGNTFIAYGSNSKSITIEIPSTVDTTKWNTYAIRLTRSSPYGGDYSVELLVNGELLLDGSSSSANRLTSQNQNSNNGVKNGWKFIVTGGVAEVDNFSIVGRERNWKTITDDQGVSIKQWLEFKDRNDVIADDGFGAAGTALGSKWSAEGNVELTAESCGNTTPYLRITQTGGVSSYFDYPYADINGGVIPFDQVTTYEFDASFAGGGELGLTLYGSRTFDGGVQAIRYMTVYIRPAIGDMPAGVYRNVSGVQTLMVDLSDVDMDAWNSFKFELNLNGAQEAYCYVNGVKKTGTIGLNNLAYSATNANLKKCQMWLSTTGPVGYMDVDNVKLHYTMWGPAPDFADGAVLSVTDMTDNGFTLSWPEAANATSYDVYLDNVKKATTTETSYVFEGLATKAYGVKVVAVSTNNPNATDELTNVALLVGEGDVENFETAFGEKVLYDDYIDLSKAPYSIGDKAVGILEQYPTSYAVGTTTKDAAVLTYDASTKTLHAVGVGAAKIVIGDKVYSVGVEAAPISLFMITGHSVGAGSKGNKNLSIVCEPGQVYSSHESEAVRNIRDFALAGTLNPAEQTLTLHSAEEIAAMGIGSAAASRPTGIDALVTGGGGAVAADSGFAYQWNKLTGEKVWMLNCAVGGSNQTFWMPDQDAFWEEYNADPNNIPRDQLDLSVNAQHYINMYGTMYPHSVDLFQAAQTILTNEIAAGHYTLSHMGILNFTGANGDEWVDHALATQRFNTMWEAYKEDLAMDMDGDGVAETVESIGLMPVYHLNNTTDKLPSDFINFTKAVNHHMAASNAYPHVYMAALDQRQWVTNEGVEAYFADYDLSYTVQNGTITRPTTVDDIFPIASGDCVHYQQIAYNTLGQEMAKRTNMYYKGDAGADEFQLVTAENYVSGDRTVTPLSSLSPIQLNKGQEYRFGVLCAPGGFTFVTEGAISLDMNEMGTIKAASTDGVGYLTVKDGDTVLETIQFKVGNPVVEHTCTPGEVEIENETESTCKVAGTYDEVTYCTECGEELSRVQKTKDLDDHIPGAEATCTEDQTCTVCGEVLNEKLGHTEGAAATCTEDQTCTVCGEVLATKLGHTPGAGATCTEDQTCSVCGEVLATKLGHTPGAGATCTEDQTCTVCGETLTTQLGHIPGAEVTCTEDQTCTVCGTVLAEKLGHTEGTAATCTEDQTCTVCGEVLAEKLGHTNGDVQFENETDSTCKVAGTYDEVIDCSVCGDEVSREHKTKELDDHKPGEVKVENETESTCSVPGTYQEVIYCTVCGEEQYRETKFKDLADHKYNDGETECYICGGGERYVEPSISLGEGNKINFVIPSDKDSFDKIMIFYVGNESTNANWAGLVAKGKKYPAVNGVNGFKFYTDPEKVPTLKIAGNYVLYLYYHDENDVLKNVRISVTAEGKEYISDPTIGIDENNRVVIEMPDEAETFKHVVIFYTGAVSTNGTWAEAKPAALLPENVGVNGIRGYKVYKDDENLPELTAPGEYVLYLYYYDEGVLRNVHINVTVAE